MPMKTSLQKYLCAAGLLAASITLVACGGGSSSGTTAPVPAPVPVPVAAMSVSSTSYTDGGVIPLKHAGTNRVPAGSNISPALTITNVPAGTTSFAIVMDDEVPPCGTGNSACVHWGVFNLPATKVAIAENENLGAISGVVLGGNYNGTAGYEGPNPPSNHVYRLTVYALSSGGAVAAPVTYTRSQFQAAFASRIVGSATYTGRFPN